MEHSNDIGKLAEALAKAQAQMMGAKKDSKNPFFKSDYADLKSVTDAVKGPLNDNGISWTQCIGNNDKGYPQVTTILMHKSGQYISSSFALAPKKNDPQAMGSAITYARRYSLAAICGVYQTDDDGEASMDRQKKSHSNGREDFPRYGSKDLNKREGGVFKRPKPSDLPKTKSTGEMIEEAMRECAKTINPDMILNHDDLCVANAPKPCVDKALKDCPDYQDAVISHVKAKGASHFNMSELALFGVCRELKRARPKEERTFEKSAQQRAANHKQSIFAE